METNNLTDGLSYHNQVTAKIKDDLDWTSPDLVRITRIRFLGDVGYPALDKSYCHGVNKKGEPVNVILPFSELPVKNMKRELLNWAKKDKVYLKGLGVFNGDVISILR